ncbi:hypothetical protein [Nitrosovibrio sp. Nv6]|uniref:hypothetical protein n=1 Tax=Nitrosovibrio sp. Nv6 TaxID=1855340 RepID=UPI000B81F036|nr:hypothetical protein [Nitrosovibrio sp. Nv6]
MIEDNLLPGQEVSFGRMFCLIYRSELEAIIFLPKQKLLADQQANQITDGPDEMSEPSDQNNRETT